jgi:Arc/MetJ-type ribon-helix-helix transcriptional regulator
MGDFLFPDAGVAYSQDMDAVVLPAELQRLASEAVAAGRYESFDELVGVRARLLRRFEAERMAFVRSLAEAEADSEREGFLTSEEVHAEMTALIDELRRAHV